MMQFTVEFYETSSGQCPVRDFLNELKESNPDDFASVIAGLAKLRNRLYHRPPLSKRTTAMERRNDWLARHK